MGSQMRWDKAHVRDVKRSEEDARHDRTPHGYSGDERITSEQRDRLRYWARRADVEVTDINHLTQDEALELIGYCQDVSKGITR